MHYYITNKELSDRNRQRQQRFGYPNIPAGSRVWVTTSQNDLFVHRWVNVTWNNTSYLVRARDVGLIPTEITEEIKSKRRELT